MRFKGVLVFFVLTVLPFLLISQVKLKFTDTRFLAYMEHRGDYSRLSEKFKIIYSFLEDSGYRVTGPAEALFLSSLSTPKEFRRSEARVPVYFPGIYPPCSKGIVKFKRERALLVASVIFKGPYRKIFSAYNVLLDYIEKNNLKITGYYREIYYNSPDNTPEEELLTEIQAPVNRKGKVDVGIYIDPGAYYKNLQASQEFFEWAGVSYKTVRAKDIISGKIFKSIKVIYFPGGFSSYYSDDIGKKGAEKLRKFLKGGGAYLGICAGAYFPAQKIVWKGIEYKGILKLHKKSIGPIHKIAPWPQSGNAEVLTLNGSKRKFYYLGGPYFVLDKKFKLLAKYTVNDKPSGVYFKYGKGKVVLLGFHPELKIFEGKESDYPLRNGQGVDKSGWDFLKMIFNDILLKSEE